MKTFLNITGSDLVTSLSKTLDKKLEKLRSNQPDCASTSIAEIITLNGDKSNHQEEHCSEITSQKSEMNGGHNLLTTPTPSEANTDSKRPKGKFRVGGNGIKKNWRRNSMIERRVTNGDICNVNIVDVKECTSHDNDKEYYRNPSLHRLSGVKNIYWNN